MTDSHSCRRCPGRHTGRLSSGRTDRSAFRPTAPLLRCPAVRRPAPTRPWYVGVLDKYGDGPLVSSQERRVAVVLVINRLSSAGQPLVSFFLRFTKDFLCRTCEESFRTAFFNALGARGSVVSLANRPVGVRSCPVPPRPAASLSPPRIGPLAVCSNFGFDSLDGKRLKSCDIFIKDRRHFFGY